MNNKFKDCLKSTIALSRRDLDETVAEGFVGENKEILLSEEILDMSQFKRLSGMIGALNQDIKKLKVYLFLRSLAWQVLHNELDHKSVSSYFSNPSDDKLVKLKVEHIIQQALEYQIEKSKSIESLGKSIETAKGLNNEAIRKALRKSIKIKYLYFEGTSDNKLVNEAKEIKDSEPVVSFIGYKLVKEKISDFFKRINSFLAKKIIIKNPKINGCLGISEIEVRQALNILKDFPFEGQHMEKFSKLLEEYANDKEMQVNDKILPDAEINQNLRVVAQPVNFDSDFLDLSNLPIKSLNELNITREIYAPDWSNVLVMEATAKSNPDQRLALKVVKGSKFEIFKKQAVYMNKMKDHNNFLSLYGVFEDNYNGINCCCLVMEYCEMTLKDFFERKEFTDLPIEKRQETTYKFANILINAFYCLNLKGITHKDIKPQNILVKFNEKGEPILKVVDFDVSSDYSNAARNAERAHVTAVVGTVEYAAPEVLKIIEESKTNENRMKRIEASLDSVKADVYSLGLTLLRMALENNGKIFGLNRLQGKDIKKSKDKLKKKVGKVLNNEKKYISHRNLQILLKSMLVVNPVKRNNFEGLLKLVYVEVATFKNELE